MNLTGDPWIPVVLASGESRHVSLADAFSRGDEILDLVATPPQRIGLTRLLVCIAQAALDGPEDEEEWRTCRGRIAPSAIDYLARWRDRFELYGENAFLQVPNLEAKPNPPVDKLDCTSAVNAGTLFDHAAGAEAAGRPPEWCALMLVTFQSFSPSGLIGVTRWNGRWTSKKEVEKDQDGSDSAPALEGSPLHAIVRGRSLIATTHWNLLTKELVAKVPGMTWGRPTWEAMPGGRQDTVAADHARSYLGRLVPVARAIKLERSAGLMTLANGIGYSKVGESRDPSTTVYMRQKNAKVKAANRRLDPTKHPWRDLSSLLALGTSAADGGPLALGHLRSLRQDESFDLWVGGLAMDPHPGKASKFLDCGEWVLSVPAGLLGSTELRRYGLGVKLANGASSALAAAIAAYYEDLAVGEFKQAGDRLGFARKDPRSREQRDRVTKRAASVYWRSLDGAYGVLIETANEPVAELGGAWYSLVRSAMNEAFERACAHESPRQIRAFAKGARRLRLRKPE